MKRLVAPERSKRPLENFHPPANLTGKVVPFSMPSIPGVAFTILHSESAPAQHGECSYMVNNASIVMMVEIEGIKMLFTGDANGKERTSSDGTTAKHIEGRLLALDQTLQNEVLRADLIKAPHHGSETANTSDFIDAVNPDFVIVSASTRHHLPKRTVLNRYANGQRVILNTGESSKRMDNRIVCGISEGVFDCQYLAVIQLR